MTKRNDNEAKHRVCPCLLLVTGMIGFEKRHRDNKIKNPLMQQHQGVFY